MQHEDFANLPQTDVTISLRPITDDDLEFLFRLYASTRAAEKVLLGWPDEQWEIFIRMQFQLQHAHYMKGYSNASFDVIERDGTAMGKLYVNRGDDEIRIIDITVLPEYQGKGIGRRLLEMLNQEGDETGLPVTLHVEKDNPALNLYLRLGFRLADDRGFHWLMTRSSEGNGEARTR